MAKSRTLAAAAALGAGLAGAAQAQDGAAIVQAVDTAPGRAVYERVCAMCHDNPDETKSPSLDSLHQMGLRAISYALTDGKMRVQAASLTDAEIDAVVAFLAPAQPRQNDWIATASCDAGRRTVDSSPAIVTGFGLGLHNHRAMSAAEAGLTRADLGNLELAWAMGFPQTGNMRAQPAIVGDTMFLPIADSGQLFALDVGGDAPCVKWVYEHPVPLRTHVQYGEVDGRDVLIFGDGAAHVQMLEAASGELVWRTSLRVTSVSNTTGMPVLYDGRVYAPVSSGELNMGAAADYECCTSHGAVVALDASTGEFVWTYHTMDDAQPTRTNSVGTQLWGPSGAPIWTTPAIDEARGLLYVGTGENTSEPPTDSSDAVLALDLETGALVWSFQATANDIFLTGCMFEPGGPNCPPEYSVNGDYDFGASMILADRAEGDIVLAGQKNGVLWALDADSGDLLWDVKLGPGGPGGGIHWGIAYDPETDRVFAPVNKVGIPLEDPGEPGLHAVEAGTGEVAWSWLNAADCSGDRAERISICATNYGLSAAVLLVDGAVVQGGNDGFIRVFDGDSGEILFAYDTARAFDAVNGVPANGGSIDNASVIAANGALFVQSGYGILGDAGNVLLAFRPAGR